MGIRDRVLEFFGGVNNNEIADIRNRSFEAGYYDGYADGNDDPATSVFKAGGQGYKRLSDKYIREGRIDFVRALETAWTLLQKSPVAKRVLTLKRDHIIGHNAQPDSNDEKLLEILNEFWTGNRLDKRASEFTMQLFGFGEQCYPAFVRKSDGRVRLGYIDPVNIEKIIKHPENALEDWAVCVKKSTVGTYYDQKMVYRIIREDEDYADEELAQESQYRGKLVTNEQATIQPWETEMLRQYYGKTEYDGACFYAKVNAVSNQDRGMSDLLQVGDWIDQADEVLFQLGDREGFAGYFSFDVTLTNADESKVRSRSAELRNSPPEKGSVNVHNDAEIWQMHAPELHQSGSVESFRAILGLILGGMGFPVHWYGYGDDANRATAMAQGDPTVKSLEHDQGIVEDMFLSMLQFAADQAEIAGTYTAPDDLEITLSLPEVSTKDMSRIAASMQALVVGLTNAQDNQWITHETAATAFAKIMAEFDIQYDVQAELEQIEKEGEQAELDRVAQMNGQLQQILQGQQQMAQGEMGGNGRPEEDEMV